MRRIILMAILCGSQVFGQASSEMFTGGISNGRAWNVIPEEQKGTYLIAYRDYIYYRTVLDKTLNNTPWAKGFVVNDYVRELDALYKDTENVHIPIPFGFAYCTKKLAGENTKKELETMLIALRKQIATIK